MEIDWVEFEKSLRIINEQFYDDVYEDPWLGLVFKHIPKEFIIAQQIDFMLQAFGGPARYAGRNPGEAHPHIFITHEMWQVREEILINTFIKMHTPDWIKEKWLKIDEAFKKRIIMKDPSEMKKRFASDELIIIERPQKKVA